MRYSFTVIIQVHALLNCRFQVRYSKMLFFEKPQRPPLDRFRPRQKAATRRCGLKMASINATVLRTVVGPVKESQVETLKFLICCDCIDNCCDQKRTKYAQVGDRTPSLIRQLASSGSCWDELAATTPLTTPPSFCPRTLC